MTAETWLDGNALGGVLSELLGGDMTSMLRRCDGCGEVAAIGAHRLYEGAGFVLRCPGCGDVALRVVVAGEHRVVHLEGSWVVEAPRTPV
ncbi:DUF6510 family protein [Conexibacter sp. SYSU D00693]|uniref:DUF6510 family protein n=1 Tax=Conexibacter sp. SYSU D00693 TaxID=2812560 RepID=UPI00196B9447|nr:DUF6510 family protein [Conexibacter sp. SYSU D00693]